MLDAGAKLQTIRAKPPRDHVPIHVYTNEKGRKVVHNSNESKRWDRDALVNGVREGIKSDAFVKEVEERLEQAEFEDKRRAPTPTHNWRKFVTIIRDAAQK